MLFCAEILEDCKRKKARKTTACFCHHPPFFQHVWCHRTLWVGGIIHLLPVGKNGQAWRCSIPPTGYFSAALSAHPSLSLSHQLPCHGLLFLLEIMQVISLRRSVINSLMMEHITIKCGEAMQGSTLTEPPSPVRFTQTKADFSCPKLSVPSEAQGGSLLSLIVTQILLSGPSVQPCRLPGDVQLTGIEGICKSFSEGTVWQEWAHGILHLLHNILLLLLGRTQLCCLNFWAGAKYSEGKYQLN